MSRIQSSPVAQLKVITETKDGRAKDVILDEAETWGADLIVVGSHGYHGLRRFLLGSVSQAVAAHAPCSVEIVRRRSAGE
jgi:nucleotide-binding universal stress UspA family protein